MTFEKVAQILADYKGIDVADVKPESTFTELGLDSLDTVELDENLKCVNDIVALIDAGK